MKILQNGVLKLFRQVLPKNEIILAPFMKKFKNLEDSFETQCFCSLIQLTLHMYSYFPAVISLWNLV